MFKRVLTAAAVLAIMGGVSACGDSAEEAPQMEEETFDQPDVMTDEVDPRVPADAILMDTTAAGTGANPSPDTVR